MFLRVFFLLLAFAFSAANAQNNGVQTPWQAGKEYFLIDPAQPTASGDKIEVLEIFSYGCPHCAEFQPYAEKIKASLPANAQWSYMPAEFQPSWSIFARAFYTALALGIVDKSHQPLFNAIYVDHKISQKPAGIEDLANFYTGYGVKAADFVDTAKSFAVETKLKRAQAMIKAYGVEGTPTIIVNGKYRLSNGTAGSYENLLAIIKFLVAKESSAAKPK